MKPTDRDYFCHGMPEKMSHEMYFMARRYVISGHMTEAINRLHYEAEWAEIAERAKERMEQELYK